MLVDTATLTQVNLIGHIFFKVLVNASCLIANLATGDQDQVCYMHFITDQLITSYFLLEVCGSQNPCQTKKLSTLLT